MTEADAIDRARRLLEPVTQRPSAWPVLAATMLAAASALLLVGVLVLDAPLAGSGAPLTMPGAYAAR